MITVTVNGCFDVLHVAHVRLLQKAKAQGDWLIVLLNSDSSIKRLKGKSRPINKEQDRKEMLLALRFVDEVVIFYEDTPLKALELIMPDVHVKGGKFDVKKTKAEKDLVESWSGEVVFFPRVKGYSSTKVIKKAGLVR